VRKVFTAAVAASSFILSSSAAFADTTGIVRGTVTLGAGPVAGAAVVLRGEGTTLRATTDAKGGFVFGRVPFGRYTVSVHRDGTADVSRELDVQSDAVVDASLALDQLKEIGRTATATTRGAGSAPVSVNSITRAQIATLPDNQSLDRVIETVPGIVRFSYNEPVAHGFHGLSYEIDGVPLPQGTTSNFGEIIDPRTIDSLEVFTGAFPAEYGGSRQGAVVNIISRRASDFDSGAQGLFTLGAGTYGSAQGQLKESVAFGHTHLFFNANEERTNRGIDTPTFDPVHAASNNSNQFLRTITDIGRDTLAIDASNSYQSFQIPNNPTFNINDPVVNVPYQDDVQGEYGRFFNLVYTHNAANGSGYTQIAPWYRYDRVAYNGDLAADQLGFVINDDGSTTPLDGLQQDRRSQFTGLRITQFNSFGANSVKAGLDGSLENFSGSTLIAQPGIPNFTTQQSQRGTTFGAYIEDKWTPTKYLSVLGGLRFDHSTGYVSGAQLSPRIEINGQVDPQDILHFYYGRLYAAPFIEDTRADAIVTSGVTTTGGGLALPTYDLQPEHDSYYEFGLQHVLAPNVRSTLNFWKRDVNNVLDTTQIFPTPIFAVYNNTIGIAKGVEGRIDARFKNGDSMFLSTTLSNSQAGGISGGTFLFCPTPTTDCLSGIQDVTLNPEDHDQTFAVNADYTKRFGGPEAFFASLEPQYGTGYPVQFQNGAGRLPPHLTLDASFGLEPRRGAHPRTGFTADFTNFTNTQYLLKINNGFNTTQWGEGFRAGIRVIQPF
jgi:outer membrane receptor protein involved in Fe transport